MFMIFINDLTVDLENDVDLISTYNPILGKMFEFLAEGVYSK
jgi:hypothetical protein